MNKFQPHAGMYFYTAVKPITRDVDDFMGNVTQIVRQDNSYHGYVFYCIATDNHTIVCECVFGGSNYSPKVFVRGDYDFTPIGPDVMSALRSHFKHQHS